MFLMRLLISPYCLFCARLKNAIRDIDLLFYVALVGQTLGRTKFLYETTCRGVCGAGMPRQPNKLRLAVMSGPRSLSTSLLRSWGMRADTFVIDEPFYPVCAKKTDCQYLGAKEIVEKL